MAEGSYDRLGELTDLVKILRSGCPWDRAQTHRSLRPYLLEESYEVIDALDDLPRAEADHTDVAPAVTEPQSPRALPAHVPGRVGLAQGKPPDTELDAAVAHLAEELGDLLFQICFHSELAAEKGWFTIDEVAEGVTAKLTRRHPHVFGGPPAADAGEVAQMWEERKALENPTQTVLDSIPRALPALASAQKAYRRLVSRSIVGAVDVTTACLEAGRALDRLLPVTKRAMQQPVQGEAGQSSGPGAVADPSPELSGLGEPVEDVVSSDAWHLVGQLLNAIVVVAEHLGVDAELALRESVREMIAGVG